MQKLYNIEIFLIEDYYLKVTRPTEDLRDVMYEVYPNDPIEELHEAITNHSVIHSVIAEYISNLGISIGVGGTGVPTKNI